MTTERTFQDYVVQLSKAMADGFCATAEWRKNVNPRKSAEISEALRVPIEYVRLMFLASEDELLSSPEHSMMTAVRQSSVYLEVEQEMLAYGITPRQWATDALFFCEAIESGLATLSWDDVEVIDDVFYFVSYACSGFLESALEMELTPELEE